MVNEALRRRVQAWIDGDPDPVDRAELERALERGDEPLLAQRFAGRLSFGTAGLRGPIGAGPHAMNTAVIRQTCHGLADVLSAGGADPARGVVIGFDARHRSSTFALESAAVLRARGFKVFLWDSPGPTPATSFWVRRLGALAGIQVTASHNPPQDNGFKVYWDHAAQIIPPIDDRIAAAIARHASGPACELAALPEGHEGPELAMLGEAELAVYLQQVTEGTPATSPTQTPVRVVYTAMHGVGGESVCRVLQAAGFEVHIVEEQHRPDGRFPTVDFPNPEEDGALDLALALAERVSADLVLANDPDADRLAVAVPDAGGWRLLNGNEIGLLLGDHCLRAHGDEPALVAASIVSSQALAALAARRGHHFVSALTGFKWIMAERRRRPDQAFLFGYEEALGYCVGEAVADKDGVSAALAFAHRTRQLKAEGLTLLEQLEMLYAEIGAFVSSQWVQRFEGVAAGQQMAAAVERARRHAPPQLGALALLHRHDFQDGAPWDEALSANLIALHYGLDEDELRILIRPSGTEPKVKTYFEYRSAQGVKAAQEALTSAKATWRQAMEDA